MLWLPKATIISQATLLSVTEEKQFLCVAKGHDKRKLCNL